MKLVRLLLAIVAVVSLTPVIQGEEGVSGRARIELALRDYAKLMCSAVFISGRDLPEAERDSGPLVTENIGSSYSIFTEADRATAQVHIDRKRKVVATTFRDFVPGMARFYGDQGCVILPRGVENAFFTPKKASTRLPPANTQSWPMSNISPQQPLPDGIDPVKLNSAVHEAFSDPAGQTFAFLVVYKGQIVAERYGLGTNKETLVEGWSMGKSLLAASKTWVRTTITRHPAPISCRKEPALFSLKNKTIAAKNSRHAGTKAISALSSVTFIVDHG